MPTLEVRDLYVSVDGKEILKGLNFTVNKGEVHALMGPNGSGKSTLAYTIMGHPKYKVESGDILFEGKSILEMKPDERAKLGLFLAFQYPVEVPGVTLFNFLWKAIQSNNLDSTSPRVSKLPVSSGVIKISLLPLLLTTAIGDRSRSFISSANFGGSIFATDLTTKLASPTLKFPSLKNARANPSINELKGDEMKKLNSSGFVNFTSSFSIKKFLKRRNENV